MKRVVQFIYFLTRSKRHTVVCNTSRHNLWMSVCTYVHFVMLVGTVVAPIPTPKPVPVSTMSPQEVLGF